MQSSTTFNNHSSEIKNTPDKESRAFLPGVFSIADLKQIHKNWDNNKRYSQVIPTKEIASSLLKDLKRMEDEMEDILYRKASKENESFWREMFMELNINPLRSKTNRLLILQTRKTYGNKLNIDQAKAFPITDLLDFKGRVTHCIFHNEKTPSLYYYPATNTCYCFSCHQYADSIKIYQQLNNCTFINAVKALQK